MEQDIELIEKYLADQLSAEDKQKFETRLQQDPEFAKRMKLIQETRMAVQSDVDLFRSDLDEVFAEYQASKKPTFSFYRSPRLIAASIILLLGVGLGYFFLKSSDSPQELYTAYFEVPQENLTVRDNASNETLKVALEAYNSGNYQAALEQFDKILVDSAQDYGVLFYSSICLMMLERSDESITRLQEIPLEATSYYAPSIWYQAMNHLKQGELETGKSLLLTLAESHSGKYGNDARELLKKLP